MAANPPNTHDPAHNNQENINNNLTCSSWFELDIKGQVRNISLSLWTRYTHLTVLYLNDNKLDRISPEIAKLTNLQYLDLSNNRLKCLPQEVGNMVELRKLLLNNNLLRTIPYEIGKLFQLEKLGLNGNEVPPEMLSMAESNLQGLLQHMIDNLRFDTTHPPQRPWIALGYPERKKSTGLFTVMSYNILCDTYCNRAKYGYTPTWALHWDYRKKGILEEIRHYSADIVNLQEVEKVQYNDFFLPELQKDGYEGIFEAKGRIKNMYDDLKHHVDGCAILWKKSKFKYVKQRLIEFSEVANRVNFGDATGVKPRSSQICERVSHKDHIALCAVLETTNEIWENGCPPPDQAQQQILVSTVHFAWEPEYSDVKLIQSMILMSELRNFADTLLKEKDPEYNSATSVGSMPIVLCGDLNSLPDSGVIEFLSQAEVSTNHVDFQDIDYEDVLKEFSNSKSNDAYTHSFDLRNAYDREIMEFTNYTYAFKGVIDYVFYADNYMNPMGVLGPLSKDWFEENKVVGCPHPHIPSDHFSLLVEFELRAEPKQKTNNRRH